MLQATSPVTPETPPTPQAPPVTTSRSTTRREQRSANTLYQELSFTEAQEDGDDDSQDCIGI